MGDRRPRRRPDQHSHQVSGRRLHLRWLWPTDAHVRRLTVVALVDSLGSGMFLSASAVLFVTQLHLRPAQIGYGLATAGVLGLLCAVPWGATADRLGPRRILVLLQFWRAAGFASYVFVHNFPSFLAVTVFLGIAEKA
ncbi:MAG: MFS transporter, partial [Micromonosporaceae bacterium]